MFKIDCTRATFSKEKFDSYADIFKKYANTEDMARIVGGKSKRVYEMVLLGNRLGGVFEKEPLAVRREHQLQEHLTTSLFNSFKINSSLFMTFMVGDKITGFPKGFTSNKSKSVQSKFNGSLQTVYKDQPMSRFDHSQNQFCAKDIVYRKNGIEEFKGKLIYDVDSCARMTPFLVLDHKFVSKRITVESVIEHKFERGSLSTQAHRALVFLNSNKSEKIISRRFKKVIARSKDFDKLPGDDYSTHIISFIPLNCTYGGKGNTLMIKVKYSSHFLSVYCIAQRKRLCFLDISRESEIPLQMFLKVHHLRGTVLVIFGADILRQNNMMKYVGRILFYDFAEKKILQILNIHANKYWLYDPCFYNQGKDASSKAWMFFLSEYSESRTIMKKVEIDYSKIGSGEDFASVSDHDVSLKVGPANEDYEYSLTTQGGIGDDKLWLVYMKQPSCNSLLLKHHPHFRKPSTEIYSIDVKELISN